MELNDNYFNFNNEKDDYDWWKFKGISIVTGSWTVLILPPVDFVDAWFLMSSPFSLIAIALSYLYFVMKLGPDIMKNRRPYSLTNIITIYNVLQVLSSSYMVFRSLEIMVPNGLIYPTCLHDTKDLRHEIAEVLYLYFCCKITELLDTIFFVLRKKQSQVTFLHIYHHFFMLCFTWFCLKYEPIYTLIFLTLLNSFVHVVMYLYYGLSSFPSIAKYLWWKKYITKLQLIQILLVLLHFFVSHVTTECKPSYALTAVVWFHDLLFAYLFLSFYIRVYMKKRNQS